MFSLLKDILPEETFEIDVKTKSRLNDILFGNLKPDELAESCETLGIIDVFKIVHEIDNELKSVSLENMVLQNFLETNDTKALFGLADEELTYDIKIDNHQEKQKLFKLEAAIKGKETQQHRVGREHGINQSVISSFHKKSVATASQNVLESRTKLYRLNFKTKVELADKLAKGVKFNIRDAEVQMRLDIKKINSEIEEVNYDISEVDNCRDSFNRNVVFLGLDPDTGHISAEKFVKFSQSFCNTGLALMSNLRLASNNIQQEIFSLTKKVSARQEMGGILQSVDFDLLMINKSEELKTFDDQMNSLFFLKGYHGKVSYGLALRRKELVEMEANHKKLVDKIRALRKSISSAEKGFEVVEEELYVAREHLGILKNQMEVSSAPKIFDYITLKEELSKLGKEKKTLTQSINILQMRLKNAYKKYKFSK